MDSMCVVLSLSSRYYCVNLGHNAIIIMILLFLFGARYHYHHDIIGDQWGNLMIPLYDITMFLFLWFFFPRRGPLTNTVLLMVLLYNVESAKGSRLGKWFYRNV